VQVVEHKHEGSRLRGAPKKRAHRLEESEAVALRPQPRGLGKIGEQLAQLGKKLGEIRRPGTQLGPERVRLGLTNIGAQPLNPGPIGGGAPRLPAPADHDARAARPRMPDQLVGEPALADAGLAGQENESSTACEHVLQRSDELGQLTLASHEDAA
jgi:hypothetical protein